MIGLSFYDDEGMLGMVVNLQSNDSSVKSIKYTSGLINYDDFFPKAEVGIRMMKGKLYYFGIFEDTMNNTVFSKYSGINPILTYL